MKAKIRKIFILSLISTSFLLVSCGEKSDLEHESFNNKDEINKNDVENYLGSWNTGIFTITFNKGNIGRYEYTDKEDIMYYDFKYEVNDGVVNVSCERMGTEYRSCFELNDDGTILTAIQNGFPVRPKETDFCKQ